MPTRPDDVHHHRANQSHRTTRHATAQHTFLGSGLGVGLGLGLGLGPTLELGLGVGQLIASPLSLLLGGSGPSSSASSAASTAGARLASFSSVAWEGKPGKPKRLSPDQALLLLLLLLSWNEKPPPPATPLLLLLGRLVWAWGLSPAESFACRNGIEAVDKDMADDFANCRSEAEELSEMMVEWERCWK